MKLTEVIRANVRKLPRNRDFWFSMALFGWAGFTVFVLVDGYATATRWLVFRRVVQFVLFIIWGMDRYKKYKSSLNASSSS